MESFTNEDVIQTLRANLRIAAATFGEESAHFQELREMVHEHLRQINQAPAPRPSNLASMSSSPLNASSIPSRPGNAGAHAFKNLVFRPKPSS